MVAFMSGSTALGTGALNGSGVATLSTHYAPCRHRQRHSQLYGSGKFCRQHLGGDRHHHQRGIADHHLPRRLPRAPMAARLLRVTATSSLGSSYPVTITVQSGPAVISGGMVTITGVGTVVLQASQAGDTDHSPAHATESFQVTPAPLTVAANNATRAYGAANPAFSGKVTGAVGSDSFTETFTTTATTSSNVGSYPIVPAVNGPQSNYTVTIVNGTLTVTAGSDHDYIERAGQRRLRRQRNPNGHGDIGFGRAGRKRHLL